MKSKGQRQIYKKVQAMQKCEQTIYIHVQSVLLCFTNIYTDLFHNLWSALIKT